MCYTRKQVVLTIQVPYPQGMDLRVSQDLCVSNFCMSYFSLSYQPRRPWSPEIYQNGHPLPLMPATSGWALEDNSDNVQTRLQAPRPRGAALELPFLRTLWKGPITATTASPLGGHQVPTLHPSEARGI